MSALKHIFFKTAEKMSEIPDGKAQLVVLSPPYLGHHSRKEKERELEFLIRLLNECRRIVSSDGVIACVNTDFKDKGMIYLRHLAVIKAAETVGLKPRDEKIWVRGFKRNQYRKKFSFILIFSKNKKIFRNQVPEYDIDNWLLTKPQIIGDFRDAIAPEIPLILIKKFTRENDLVVSSCAGTGTVVIMALRQNRRAVGYEINSKMKNIINQREKNIDDYFSK